MGRLFLRASSRKEVPNLTILILCIPHVEIICYDDACHLRKFAVRADLTAQTKQLASVEMAVDKMHMKGHTDP